MRSIVAVAVLLLLAPVDRAADFDAAARRLDERRAVLHAPGGATVYEFGRAQPGGENRSLDATLSQAPGVSRAGNGGIRVRVQ
jgi:hypothetical protein